MFLSFLIWISCLTLFRKKQFLIEKYKKFCCNGKLIKKPGHLSWISKALFDKRNKLVLLKTKQWTFRTQLSTSNLVVFPFCLLFIYFKVSNFLMKKNKHSWILFLACWKKDFCTIIDTHLKKIVWKIMDDMKYAQKNK